MSIANTVFQPQPATAQTYIPLTVHHIRFTVRATTPIIFRDFKGSALRGAFVGVLRRSFCPEWRAEQTDPLHQTLCPACQLVAAEQDTSIGGDVRRPYAIVPPPDNQSRFEPDESFTFGMTLFGDKLAYLPYLVLAVNSMGENGVGQRDEGGNRGRFVVEQIEAVNQFGGETLTMLAPGEQMVHSETLPVTHQQIRKAVEALATQLTSHDNVMRIDFLTPTRIMHNKHAWKQPDFFPFCKQIVLRILDLCTQHTGARPDIILKQDIYPYADQVELLETHTHWWDLKGYSGRMQRHQVMGGLVGHAIYRSPDWRPLLSWLLWGMSTGVGKNTVKGCGLYRVGCEEPIVNFKSP